MTAIDPSRLFIRLEMPDGRKWHCIPTSMYDQMVPTAEGNLTADFAGIADPHALRLYDRYEDIAADTLTGNTAGWRYLCEIAGIEYGRAWGVLRIQRDDLPGLPPAPRKPGDFDLIMGTTSQNGRVLYEDLTCFEFKLRKVHTDGEPLSMSQDPGVSQVRGAVELGFDRVILAHILVGEGCLHPDQHSPQWNSIANLEFERVMRGCAELVRRAEEKRGNSGPYGYALLGLGQIPKTDVRRTGAISCVVARLAPYRPLDDDLRVRQNRTALKDALRRCIGETRTLIGCIEVTDLNRKNKSQ